jgi:hypothetical protein
MARMERMVVDNEEDVAAAELILELKRRLLDVEEEAGSIPHEMK